MESVSSPVITESEHHVQKQPIAPTTSQTSQVIANQISDGNGSFPWDQLVSTSAFAAYLESVLAPVITESEQGTGQDESIAQAPTLHISEVMGSPWDQLVSNTDFTDFVGLVPDHDQTHYISM